MKKRVWMVSYEVKGFKVKIFIERTEENLWNYMETELGGMHGYSGATDEDVKAAKTIGLQIYMYK